jgi:ribonuclease HI
VDPSNILSVLRRLCQAGARAGALDLPSDLSPREALEAVRAAVKLLEPSPRVRSRAAGVEGKARVHIDGAARGNPGPAGVGVLILGPDGDVVERLHRFIGEATNNVAEYQALLLALERVLELGYTELEVRSDSELLVRQIQGRYQVKSPGLRPLYKVAREQLAVFRHFDIRHVPREENAEADRLANRGIDEGVRSRLRAAAACEVTG